MGTRGTLRLLVHHRVCVDNAHIHLRPLLEPDADTQRGRTQQDGGVQRRRDDPVHYHRSCVSETLRRVGEDEKEAPPETRGLRRRQHAVRRAGAESGSYRSPEIFEAGEQSLGWEMTMVVEARSDDSAYFS